MRAATFAAAFLLAACASVSSPNEAPAPAAVAQTVGQDVQAPVDLPAGVYRADPRHTSVLFRIRHNGLSWFTARFDTKEAALTLDPADPTHSQFTASVDAASVNTGVINSQGERSFDQSIGRALGGGPITFTSTGIDRTGANTARVTGDLTMNGQTHPATLEVVFNGDTTDLLRGGARVLGFSATAQIDRTQWGVSEWRSFTGAEVQIVIETELVRA